MIVLDTETTALTAATHAPLTMQPHIIEFAAVRLDDTTLERGDVMHFLCKPPVSVPKEMKKINGMTDDLLANEKPFAFYYPAVCEFFLGTRVMVAHNLAFDSDVLSSELRRMGKLIQFPWPVEHVCTVERTQDIIGKYLKLSDLYRHATGRDAAQTHRALDDVNLLVEIVQWMRKENRL